MKKILIFLMSVLFVLITVSCKSNRSDIPSDIEVIHVNSDREFFTNLEQVENGSTIIIEAIAKKILVEKVSTHYDYEFKKELPGSGYTQREIEVTKVYKGDVKVGDKLVLLQDYYIWTNSEGIEQLISSTALKPAKIDNKYIMFLQYYEPHEGYWPVCDYEGMFPIPNNNIITKAKDNTLEQSDLEVYDNETLHYLLPIYNEVVKKYFN